MSFRQVLAVDCHLLQLVKRVKNSTPVRTMHIADHITPHMQGNITHKLPHNRDLQPHYYTCAIQFELCREGCFMLCWNQAMLQQTHSAKTTYLFLGAPQAQARCCQGANSGVKAGACLLVCVLCASLQRLADALALPHEPSYAWQHPASQLHQLVLLLVCQLQ